MDADNALDRIPKKSGGSFEDEVVILRRIFTENDTAWKIFGNTFVDVRGNAGHYSLLLSDRFDRIHVYEPDPEMYEKLIRDLSESSLLECRGANCVIPHMSAVSSSVGTGSLRVRRSIDSRGLSNSGLSSLEAVSLQTSAVEVTVTTLDNEQIDSVGMLKIDVEGHEISVLLGSRGLLKQQRPIVVWEASEDIPVEDIRERVIHTFECFPDNYYFFEPVEGRL